METDKQEVLIGGRKYALSTQDTPEHVERMVRLLNGRLDEMRALSTRSDQVTAAIAVALSLADELIKAQDDNTRLRKQLWEANEQISAEH